MEQLFNDMRQHLADTLGSRLALVAEDCGQLDAVEDGTKEQYGVAFPCALIAMPEVEWTALKAAAGQRGRATLTVRLAFACADSGAAPGGTDGGAADTDARLELAADVNAAINGWTFEGCERAMLRTRSRQYSRKGGVKVYEVAYSTAVGG